MHLNPPFICCVLLVSLIAYCRLEFQIQVLDGDFDRREFLGGTTGWLNSSLCIYAVLFLWTRSGELKNETFNDIRIAKKFFPHFHSGKIDLMVLDAHFTVMTYNDFYRVSPIEQSFEQNLWLLVANNCEIIVPKTNKRKYMREKLNI